MVRGVIRLVATTAVFMAVLFFGAMSLASFSGYPGLLVREIGEMYPILGIGAAMIGLWLVLTIISQFQEVVLRPLWQGVEKVVSFVI